MAHWPEPFDDWRQEIVFIGIALNEAARSQRLDACLLTTDEMRAGPKAWSRLPDPLPRWGTGLASCTTAP
jgi:hypothetical protein